MTGQLCIAIGQGRTEATLPVGHIIMIIITAVVLMSPTVSSVIAKPAWLLLDIMSGQKVMVYLVSVRFLAS